MTPASRRTPAGFPLETRRLPGRNAGCSRSLGLPFARDGVGRKAAQTLTCEAPRRLLSRGGRAEAGAATLAVQPAAGSHAGIVPAGAAGRPRCRLAARRPSGPVIRQLPYRARRRAGAPNTDPAQGRPECCVDRFIDPRRHTWPQKC